MKPVLTYLQWNLVFTVVRLPRDKMHNLTIALGLVVCMGAGALTVVKDVLPVEKAPTHRLFRTARRVGKKTKEYISELWN